MDSSGVKEGKLTSSVNDRTWRVGKRLETRMMLKMWTSFLVMLARTVSLELWEWMPHFRELMSEGLMKWRECKKTTLYAWLSRC